METEMKRKRLVSFALKCCVFVFLVLSLTCCRTYVIQIEALKEKNKSLQQDLEKANQDLERVKQDLAMAQLLFRSRPQPFSTADIEMAKKHNTNLKDFVYYVSKPLIISANNEKANVRADKGVFVINGEISIDNNQIRTDDKGALDKFDENSFEVTFQLRGDNSKYTVIFKKNDDNRFNVNSVKNANGKVINTIDTTFWKDNYLCVVFDGEYEVIRK
jgi:hypothetical protein